MTLRRRFDALTILFAVGYIAGAALVGCGLTLDLGYSTFARWSLGAFLVLYLLLAALVLWASYSRISIGNRSLSTVSMLGTYSTLPLDSFSISSNQGQLNAVRLEHTQSLGIWITSSRWHVQLDTLIAELRSQGLPETGQTNQRHSPGRR